MYLNRELFKEFICDSVIVTTFISICTKKGEQWIAARTYAIYEKNSISYLCWRRGCHNPYCKLSWHKKQVEEKVRFDHIREKEQQRASVKPKSAQGSKKEFCFNCGTGDHKRTHYTAGMQYFKCYECRHISRNCPEQANKVDKVRANSDVQMWS